MAGILKHNKKSWGDYERISSHVFDEKFLLEIFVNEREYEQQFRATDDSALIVSNAKLESWKAEVDYRSLDGNDYYLTANFVAPETGDYNVEVLYRTETEGSFISLWVMDGSEVNYFMKGSPEYRSLMIHDYHLQQGNHTFQLNCNANIHVMGMVFKKITPYRADDSLKRDNRLTMIKATHTVSDMVKADELSVELLYDNSWRDTGSLTGFIFDYRDEVNFHLINSDGELEQVFGGYVSSCKLNSNETVLTVNCAGRLIDGEKRFIVEEVNIGGTASVLEDSYPDEYIRHFTNYNDACEYAFDNYQQPLNSNLSEIIHAKQYDSIRLPVNDAESFNRCKAENIITQLMPLGAYLRNNTGKNTLQRIFIYDIKWFNNRKPILLDDFPIFYIKYGMGEPVTTTEVETKSTENSGESNGSVITGKFKPSCACCSGQPYQWTTKTWRNYCPNCGKSGTLTYNPKRVAEGELTCKSCDSDFCGVCGGDKGTGRCRRKKLTSGSASEVSNSGNTNTSTVKSTFNILKAVTDECFKYNYGTGISTLSAMRETGYGDDKAFSDLIFSALSDYGVGCKTVQYNNGAISDFRSVLVKDASGNYVDFPYAKLGFGNKYGNLLNPTNKSKTGVLVSTHDGDSVDLSTGILQGKVTVSNGFDKDKMMKFYIVMEYSTSDEENAPLHQTFIDFTASKSDEYMTWSGLKPISLNNIINTSTVSIIDKMREQTATPHVYLHRIYLEYRVPDTPLWENTDSNVDNSSYRIILQEVGFRNGTLLNPVDLGSTGKSVNSVLSTIVEDGELKLKMYPSKHRRDDKVILSKDKSFNPTLTVDESVNVLGITNWDFTPVSDFTNRSLVVFKNKVTDDDKGAVYNYLETRKPDLVLRYGEINSVTSLSDDISRQEAYYEARKAFKSTTGDSLTVVLAGNPTDLHIGDYAECLFEEGTYNDIKEVMSIQRVYNVDTAPHIRTTIGLNKPAPELSLRKTFEAQRKEAKENKTLFSRTAIHDDDAYTWEE